MATLYESIEDTEPSECLAGRQEFVPPDRTVSGRLFSLPSDPFVGVRRELDAFAWSLFGRLVEEPVGDEIPLDRDEGSL